MELLRNVQYESLNPRPVNVRFIVDASGAIVDTSEPYTSYNPSPVPVEAFNVPGLDAGQIGQTGFLLVGRMGPQHSLQIPADDARREWALPRYVLVRYAWPRRPGEPVGGAAPANASP